ncbi:hypothetical protein QBC34DRAFT_457755 [Podospora aff. communis PSN243]|uniref:F-box domain-containing protein n=1 Tax=Podospora aff. communis PSN243 TaxID=3040156 RepID=A0AAV9GVA1_9PEZI|nr:hypothetical protein QBC34DRAFT_457755 [Podospora aff. communis PSN243]
MALHLLDLPVEIVSAIIELLGYEFFAEDVSRLTVSKKWRTLVIDALRNLRLTRKLVRRPCANKVLAHIKPTLLSLDLDLRGGSEIENSRIAFYFLHRHIASPCPSLRRLRIRLGKNWAFAPMLQAINALLLSATDLLTLEIDTSHFKHHAVEVGCSNRRTRYSALRRNTCSFHLCETINRLLFASLRTFDCNLHFVCERLLAVPPGDSQALLPNLQQVRVRSMGRVLDCHEKPSKRAIEVVLEDQMFALRRRVVDPERVRLSWS